VDLSTTGTTCAGIDALALILSLTYPEDIPHLMTECRSLNYAGLDFAIFSINGSASMADPSTTSMTKRPPIYAW